MKPRQIANVLYIRLKRINSDYLNYTDYSEKELRIRESEINSIAYDIAEILEFEPGFDREKFMRDCGIT